MTGRARPGACPRMADALRAELDSRFVRRAIPAEWGQGIAEPVVTCAIEKE